MAVHQVFIELQTDQPESGVHFGLIVSLVVFKSVLLQTLQRTSFYTGSDHRIFQPVTVCHIQADQLCQFFLCVCQFPLPQAQVAVQFFYRLLHLIYVRL